MGDLIGVCPKCGYKTIIKNRHACDCMCGNCHIIYNIMGDAIIQGRELSESSISSVLTEIEELVGPKVSNFKVIQDRIK